MTSGGILKSAHLPSVADVIIAVEKSLLTFYFNLPPRLISGCNLGVLVYRCTCWGKKPWGAGGGWNS